MKRRGFSAEAIRNVREAYRTVYREGLKLEDAIAALEERLPTQPELELFVQSLRGGARGLVR